MARRRIDRVMDGETTTVSVAVPVGMLPYLAKLAPKKSAAFVTALRAHATVADILRQPHLTDSEKVAELLELMPHAADALRAAQRRHDTDDMEP